MAYRTICEVGMKGLMPVDERGYATAVSSDAMP